MVRQNCLCTDSEGALMTEHRPASEQPDDVTPALRRVTLPEIPTVYALLHPENGLTAWVFELPGGDAVLVSCDEDGIDHAFWPVTTDLEQVRSFWVPLDDTELVLVTS